MQTVTFGTKNSYDDFGLILTDKDIGFPEPKLEEVDVIGADGVIDLSEVLNDDIKYKTRKLQFTFTVLKGNKYWASTVADVANYLHGKKLRIQMDFDPAYYYTGRCKINSFKTSKRLCTITIDAECEPYRLDINGNGEKWLWDTFSFQNGFIRVNTVTVNGSLQVNLQNQRKIVSPTFTCSTAMTVTFDGVTYNLPKGKTQVLGIRLQYGTNYVTFKGNGTVKIEYQGGAL
jgi:phage-related protein